MTTCCQDEVVRYQEKHIQTNSKRFVHVLGLAEYI